MITHTTKASVVNHPAYTDASLGDLKAARLVVRDLIKPAIWGGSVDFIVPVMQADPQSKWNALPLALAETLAKTTRAKYIPTIFQTQPVLENAADSVARILYQPAFTGKVPKGTYLICDDICNFGSNLANLRGHLEHFGGKVAAASTLAAALFSNTLVPDNTVLMGIAARFHHELETFTSHLGFTYQQLTSREAYFVYGLKNLECIRNPSLPAHRLAGPRI